MEQIVATPSSIDDLIHDLAVSSPNAPAIVGPGGVPLDFAGVGRQVLKTREALNGLGVGREDRVGIILP